MADFQHEEEEEEEDLQLSSLDHNVQDSPEINREQDEGNQNEASAQEWQPNVIVQKISQKDVPMFNTTGLDYEVRFANLEGQDEQRLPVDELMARITLSTQEMLNRLLQGVNGHDFIRIVIQNRYLYEAINLPFMRRDQLNVEAVLKAIMAVLNSNEEFLIDGNLKVHLIHVAMQMGGRSKTAFDSFQTRLNKSPSIVKVKNKDNMCLARAIVIGKAKIDKDLKAGIDTKVCIS